MCRNCGAKPANYDGYCGWCYGKIYDGLALESRLERIQLSYPQRLKASGVPDHYRWVQFDECQGVNETLLNRMRAWSDQPRGFLLLHGDVGRGKTHLATCAYNRWMWSNEGGAWTATAEVFSRLKLGMDSPTAPGGWTENDVRRLKACPLLLLDDLGAELTGPWQRSVVTGIVLARYNADLPTLCTSNLAPGALAQMIDDRTVSRLMEVNRPIEVTGNDRRTGKKDAETQRK